MSERTFAPDERPHEPEQEAGAPADWSPLDPVGVTEKGYGYRRRDGVIVSLNASHTKGLMRGKTIGIDGWEYRLPDDCRDGELVGRPRRPPAPFTPAQEKRLREIAWQAAETHATYWSIMRGGRPVDAATIREHFLNGGGK